MHTWNTWLSKVAPALTDALFPRRCPVCGKIVLPGGALICAPCLRELSFVKSPSCKKCGKELVSEVEEYCYDCTRHRRSFEYGIALLNYSGASRDSMAAIKYKNKREYLDFYGQAAAALCGKRLLAMKADALVPVPIHPSRRRIRGFNQAEILAGKLGEALGMPVCAQLLLREKKTDPQKTLGAAGRLRNLEQAFAAGDIPEGISSVILVDDIYTTGSTVEACTRALLKAGIKKVYFFALCIGQGQ